MFMLSISSLIDKQMGHDSPGSLTSISSPRGTFVKQNGIIWVTSWVKVQIFQNPELLKFKILKLALCLQNINISILNGQLS